MSHDSGVVDGEPEGSDARESELSYSYREPRESFAAVVFNRIAVTASLFVTAIGLSYLLGRKR